MSEYKIGQISSNTN